MTKRNIHNFHCHCHYVQRTKSKKKYLQKKLDPWFIIRHNHLSITEHASNTSPSLQNSGADLVSRERESVCTGIPELIGVRVGSITLDIGVIGGRAGGGVESRAAGANGVGSSRDSADGGLSAGCETAVLSVVFGAETAVVAVGPEDVLAVGARVGWLALDLARGEW